MKTSNKNPEWHNQPLRLSREQMQNPAPVIADFFDSYHLNEVREILWNWLVETISSPRNIASTPLERSNYIFFYENIETLIEAAYTLWKRTSNSRSTNRKKNTKKNEKTKSKR